MTKNPFEKFVAKVNPFAAFAKPATGPEPIATTADGGQVFRMSNGQLAFKSPGYATNDQEAIARIMEGATPIQEAQRTTDNLTIAQNPIAARVQEINQGVPLIGEYLDEAVGMVSPRAAKAMNQTSDAMERQNPIESGALNLLGGVAASAPLLAVGVGNRAADFVARGASKVTQGLRGAGVAAGLGAAEGASSFAGRADPGNRLQEARTGALVGGTIGAAVGAFAPILGEGVASLARRIKKLDVQTIAKEFGLSDPAARVVRRYLLSDDLDAASRVLARGGDDAMLANAGPATRQALDTAASTGGEALSIARNRVGEAVDTGSKRLLGAIDDILGTADGGIKGATKAISQRTAADRDIAYTRAFNTPIDYSTGGAGEQILSALDRIPSRYLSQAAQKANELAQLRGVPNYKQIVVSIDNAGKATLSELPNVRQLHQLKLAIGDLIDDGTDAITGKMNSDAGAFSSAAKVLRDALGDAVPAYNTAAKLGGDSIAEQSALRTGRSLFDQKTTVEDVRNLIRGGLSQDAKAALRKGMRENIESIMGRARTTIADLESGAMDFDTGQNAAAEAVAAMRNLLTRDNLIKARFALGSDAKRLFDEMQKMADVMVLRASVARGSATAIRTAGREQMVAETAPGLLRRTAGNIGNPLDAAREVSRAAVGIDPASISDQQSKYFAEIADALTRIRGPEAQRALQAVRDAMAGQPIKDADARLIGRLVSGSAGVGVYQEATRRLEGR
jgi:hypothetical protein